MTPFGAELRRIRAERGLTLKEMAAGLEVSPAYLSALEHGHRGRPSLHFVHAVCQYLGIIWDEAEALERLAALSHPRVTIDTAGLSPAATELANRLSETVSSLPQERINALLSVMQEAEETAQPRLDAGSQESN